MPYSSNAELPPAVRSSLTDADQSKWREVFNSALQEYKDERTAFKVAWAAVRKSADCRSFEFWASVEKVDLQKDLTKQRELYEVIRKHIERGGPMQAYHLGNPYAALHDVELREYEPGVLGNYCYATVFKGDPFYDACWQDMKDGKLAEFSIAGFRDKDGSTVQCDVAGCYNVLKMRIVTEISGVPKGACPEAKLTHLNAVAKSDSFFSLGADEMVSKCPDCAGIYRALVERGVPEDVAKECLPRLARGMFDARGRTEGVMTEQDQQMTKEKATEQKAEEVAKIEDAKAEPKDEAKKEDKPDVAPKVADEPKPESDVRDQKLNQMFAQLSDLSHKMDELMLRFEAKPKEEKVEPPVPPKDEAKPDAKPDDKTFGGDVEKEAVRKAAELMAADMVRKAKEEEAVAKGMVTPRPAPDPLPIDQMQVNKALSAGFGSKELAALSYDETLALRASKK